MNITFNKFKEGFKKIFRGFFLIIFHIEIGNKDKFIKEENSKKPQ